MLLRLAMEVDLRNVPSSEELLFFIRRCATDAGLGSGDDGQLVVSLRRLERATASYECRVTRRDDLVVCESDPDPYLAVRNAFEIFKARDGRARPAGGAWVADAARLQS